MVAYNGSGLVNGGASNKRTGLGKSQCMRKRLKDEGPPSHPSLRSRDRCREAQGTWGPTGPCSLSNNQSLLTRASAGLGVSHRRAGEIPCLAARCKSPREGRRHPAERSDSWGVERRVGHDLQWRGGVGDGKIADARQYQARTRGVNQGGQARRPPRGFFGYFSACYPPQVA